MPNQIVTPESEDAQYLGLDEAAQILETDVAEVRQLIDDGELHAFRLGGEFLRLRKDQVSDIKARWRINRELFPEKNKDKHILIVDKPGIFESIKDYLYFNDFYVVSLIVIAAFLYLVFSS